MHTPPVVKKGIVIMTDSLLFQIQMSEELHDSLFPYFQPTFLHIIILSWQFTVSMHQIGHSSATNMTN